MPGEKQLGTQLCETTTECQFHSVLIAVIHADYEISLVGVESVDRVEFQCTLRCIIRILDGLDRLTIIITTVVPVVPTRIQINGDILRDSICSLNNIISICAIIFPPTIQYVFINNFPFYIIILKSKHFNLRRYMHTEIYSAFLT